MVCILGCAYGGFISPSGLHRGYIYIFKKRKGGRGGSDLARIEPPRGYYRGDTPFFPCFLASLTPSLGLMPGLATV